MLNNYSSVSTNIDNKFHYNINAVSGTLRKSHPKSRITRVSLDNELLSKTDPKYTVTKQKYYERNSNRDIGCYNEKSEFPVVILQVMLCGDNNAVVEFVLAEDFEI